jgi:hypothetical protein
MSGGVPKKGTSDKAIDLLRTAISPWSWPGTRSTNGRNGGAVSWIPL